MIIDNDGSCDQVLEIHRIFFSDPLIEITFINFALHQEISTFTDINRARNATVIT